MSSPPIFFKNKLKLLIASFLFNSTGTPSINPIGPVPLMSYTRHKSK